MVRVAGADPGTSSLDLLVLDDGIVRDQHRFLPEDLRRKPTSPVRWLEERGPFDLVAGPSGYGLPLRRARDCTPHDRALLTLSRADDAAGGGVAAFSALVRAFCDSALPVVFLPGVIHLATVPAWRKVNRVDLGTPDKLCVAALALHRCAAATGRDLAACDLAVVELGTAFTSCLVVQAGRIVDGVGGTSGPLGWRSGGAWDGEAAYLLSPLGKRDLFTGGVLSQPEGSEARLLYRESLVKVVAGLRAVTPFRDIVLSGRLLEEEPALAAAVAQDLTRLDSAVTRLETLPGAWVKHAAQGAALLADGLCGGSCVSLVRQLDLAGARGTVLDGLPAERRPPLREV